MRCHEDDSGICCGVCNKNVVVVIATHERIEITTKNIKSLLLQSQQPKIVIVCSLMEELEYYKQLGVTVILEPNIPLGRKWQCGVNIAKKMNPDALMIVGSDDIIAPAYIKDCLIKIDQGFDFIGMTHWYMDDGNKLYHCEYTNQNVNFPIGSGKVYSKNALNKINWKLFNTSADRRLDDQGYSLVVKNNLKIHLYKEPKVLAIKGNWKQMNKPSDYIRSRNIICKTIDQICWYVQN